VSVIWEYFSAPNDELAAATLNWPGGPENGFKPKGLFARRIDGYPAVHGRGVDPVIALGQFEALLTGLSLDEQFADEDSRPILAETEPDARLVLRIHDHFRDALAVAPLQNLRDLAVPWSTIEEFYGQANRAGLIKLLMLLRAQAVEARGAGHHLYCWMSL